MTIRTFQSEAAASLFWLENRTPRRTSLSDPTLRMRGRALDTLDVEGTIRAIEKALVGIHDEWRGVILVGAGWRISVGQLRDGPWLERADLPSGWARLPHGLTEATLRRRRDQFRAALGELGVVDRQAVAEAVDLEGREVELVVRRSEEDRMEKPLVGWKAIADALGVSEDTAQRYADHDDLPVRRGSSGGRGRRQPFALPSDLEAWIRTREEPQEVGT